MRSSSPPKANPNPGLFDGDDKSATWSEWMLHIEPVLEFPLPHLKKAVVIDQNSRVIFADAWNFSALLLKVDDCRAMANWDREFGMQEL